MTQNALIYLVDDDPIMGRFVRKTLESEGFRVQEFIRGSQFLEALPRGIPDLVLLDLRMPSLSGEVLLEMLEEQGVPQPLRILLYSSTSAEQLAEISARYSTNGYVTKTTAADDLIAAVKNALKAPPTFGA